VRLYKTLLRRYAPGGHVKEVAHLYGMAVAYTMVDALRRAGQRPTRRSLLRAATHLDERGNPFLWRGVSVKTSPRDYFPIDLVQLMRSRNCGWKPFGGLVPTRG
jgi:branched-chain amino acid transport system substrate-binding protein